MNILLIFFAFPIAVIIFSILLQKLFNNPIYIAAFIFAIFIVVTFAAFDTTFLIATLAYTVLAFITSLLVSRLCNLGNNNTNTCLCNTLSKVVDNSNTNTNNITAALQDILEQNNNNVDDNLDDSDNVINTNSGCGCGRKRYRRF